MGQPLALSLSIAVLGGIWAYLALGPLAGFVLVWAGFIGWGCFFATGGDTQALLKTIVGGAYGVLVAWIALLIIVNVSVAALGTVWPAIVVGVTVFFLVIVANVGLLSAVPANVFGYAATVAYSLHQAGTADVAAPLESLTATDFSNPLILLIVSIAVGAIFGYASGQLNNALGKKGA
jgi:hypothetical protein